MLDMEEMCARLKRLDKKFKTSTLSPLHHDNACQLCAKGKLSFCSGDSCRGNC